MRIPLSCFDLGCSYLSKVCPMVCKIKERHWNIDMTFDCRGQGQIFLKTALLLQTLIPLSLFLMVWVNIQQNGCLWGVNSNNDFNLPIWPWVKGQGHIYLKPLYGLKIKLPFYSITEGFHISYNDCLWCILQQKFNISAMTFSQRSISHMNKIHLRFVKWNPLSIFDEGSSNIASLLLMV